MSKRRVLITGSSRGIGLAAALALAERFSITLHCRAESAAADSACAALRAAGQEPEIFYFDVADREAARNAITGSIERRGAFYGIVCNAGITRDMPFPALSGADWDGLIKVNLDGIYNVLHPAIMPMIQLRSGGRIVTLSSVSGLVGNRGQVGYSAAKAGVIGATKSLAKELAKRRISVNCVAPGLIETDMIKDLPLDEIIKHIPMQRPGKAEEVAGLISYLFSDAATYITGQVIAIDGGLT